MVGILESGSEPFIHYREWSHPGQGMWFCQPNRRRNREKLCPPGSLGWSPSLSLMSPVYSSVSSATASSKGHGLAPGWCLPDVREGDRRSRIHPMPDCPNSHFGEEAWGTRGGGQDHKQPEETAHVRKPRPQAPPSSAPLLSCPEEECLGRISTTSCSAAWRPRVGFRAGGMMVTAAHSVHTVPS